jgi:ribosomal protein L1
VTEDVVNAIRQQADAVLFKADVDGCISAVIGKVCVSFIQQISDSNFSI